MENQDTSMELWKSLTYPVVVYTDNLDLRTRLGPEHMNCRVVVTVNPQSHPVYYANIRTLAEMSILSPSVFLL